MKSKKIEYYLLKIHYMPQGAPHIPKRYEVILSDANLRAPEVSPYFSP